MVEKFEHSTLGDCRVLLEITLNNGKCFKLIETYKVKKNRTVRNYRRYWSNENVWLDSRSDGRSKRPHYYAMWGMTHNPESMGVTKITTPAGNNPARKKINQYFLDLVKVSETMQFKH